MISKEILKKIKQIELSTRRLLSGSLVGDSRSAIKGSGLEFDQIREYQLGDDVRFIDWKSSVRMDKILVKQYREERNRTVLLAVDVSSSMFFSSGDQLKSESVAQIASVLALVASYGKDQVGLILFSDDVELCIPPASGRSHVRKIMETVLSHAQSQKKTNICAALRYAVNLKRKDVILFVLSDFIGNDFSKSLGLAASRYDVVAMRCVDAHEQKFPAVGFLECQDSETGQSLVLDARGKGVRSINAFLHAWRSEQDALFKKYGVDCIEITSRQDFMGDLIKFFRRRMRY
ncbi:MAG: DUF58 domain-containing protein [Candidatus Dependentiae bacterium]|nr:DUF58 domain-containing protein [Candidatus Dependentiae bacterium]